jgi:hypothetical protein
MLAYNGLNQPAKVIEAAVPLFQHEMRGDFEDPMQALSASYVAVSNLAKLGHPTGDQVSTARAAARELLALAPDCLKGNWEKARPELEAQARAVLARRN